MRRIAIASLFLYFLSVFSWTLFGSLFYSGAQFIGAGRSLLLPRPLPGAQELYICGLYVSLLTLQVVSFLSSCYLYTLTFVWWYGIRQCPGSRVQLPPGSTERGGRVNCFYDLGAGTRRYDINLEMRYRCPVMDPSKVRHIS